MINNQTVFIIDIKIKKKWITFSWMMDQNL